MTDGDLARLDIFQHFISENVGDKAEILIAANRLAVRKRHSGAYPTSVLHGVKGKVGKLQHLFLIRAINAENAAFLT